MNRLIVWRHGQTVWNADGRFQGHQDIDLSDLGRQQAAEAAQRIAQLNPTHIVASDLKRAGDTARSLAEVTGLPVLPDPRLRERYFGPWQGLTFTEIAERWPDESVRWRLGESAVGLGIETVEEVAKRATAALAEAAALGGTVVVATHGGTARIGCGSLLGWPERAARTLVVLGNCHWAELRSDQVRGWRLWSYNTA